VPKELVVAKEAAEVERRLEVVGERLREIVKVRAEGNAKFLEIVKWCVENELRISGLLKDVTINETNHSEQISLWQQLVEAAPMTEAECRGRVEAKMRQTLLEAKAEVAQMRAANGEKPATGGTAGVIDEESQPPAPAFKGNPGGVS
jgi:hypothetical protein